MSQFGPALETDRKPGPALPLRLPGTDFYCLRFGVWYSSFDCAVRTKFRTCEGCLRCDQGRFNLKRHSATLRDRHYALPVLD